MNKRVKNDKVEGYLENKESSWGRVTQQGTENNDSDPVCLKISSGEQRIHGASPLVSQIITLLNSLSPPSLKHCILMS